MMSITKVRITPTLGLIVALLLTAGMYWPGLSGSYLFDDYPNIVENHDLQIRHIDASSLVRAALASPSSELKRPFASLSFSANFYLTGLDPFWMKLTNLFIHLLNGILIYALALAMIRAAEPNSTRHHEVNSRWLALLITTGWLLLPINLTSVLYVVQRMESLANLLVLLGLLGYVHARQRMQHDGRGFFYASASILLATATGLTAKETAVMTPLYAGLIEWALFRARSATRSCDYRVISLFVVILIAPLILGLAWQLPKILNAGTWTARNFNLHERLLTEARVIVGYIGWTLLPTPKGLSFYHDNYPVSTGWLQPWSTLACTLILAALLALAVAVRKRAPLVALGITLFMGSHLLTGTILPLELVYEHRNYFASFGVLLALIPLLAGNIEKLQTSKARLLLLGGLLMLWGLSTVSTAMAWGSPSLLARTLAERAPDSPRAEYGLGYTYLTLSGYDPQSPFTTAAYASLEKAMHLPNASILPEHALILMNAYCKHQPAKDEWWESMIKKLKARRPGPQDEGSLESLMRCASRGECRLDPGRTLDVFLAALSHPNPSARLLTTYGLYAWNVLRDRTLGLSLLHDAVDVSPNEPVYRIKLIQMLIMDGRRKEAQQEIDALNSLNTSGRLDPDINKLRAQLNAIYIQPLDTVGIDKLPKATAN